MANIRTLSNANSNFVTSLAVSRYGWLTTSYDWLAGYRRLAAAYGLHLKSADKLLSKVTFETCRRRLKTFFSNC